MIKYSLICKSQYCSKQKNFDGWFQNIEAFQNQKSKGLILCPLCGSDEVIKSLTTPSFHLSKAKLNENEVDDKNLKNQVQSSNKIKDISVLLRAMKKEIKKNSEFVGDNFVKEVRSMKTGETKERSIYGNGTQKDIEELKEEGVNVLSIPWVPEDH